MKKTVSLVLILTLGRLTGLAKADYTFGTPVNLGAYVNTSASEAMPGLSADGLSLFFSGNTGQPQRPGGYGSIDMWVTL